MLRHAAAPASAQRLEPVSRERHADVNNNGREDLIAIRRALRASLLAVALSGSLLVGCSKSSYDSGSPGPQGSGVDLAKVPPSEYPLPTSAEAARFLNQASFGATDAEITKLKTYGYSAWLEDQFFMPGASHEAYINAVSASLPAGQSRNDWHVMNTFWKQAATGQG